MENKVKKITNALLLTSVAVAQPQFFKQKSHYFLKLDFKTAILKNGCFFVYDFHFPKTGDEMTRK